LDEARKVPQAVHVKADVPYLPIRQQHFDTALRDTRFLPAGDVAQSAKGNYLSLSTSTEALMTSKLSREVIAAYGAAMVASFQVLINCLEENDALQPGQFPHALGVYMEMVKSNKGDVSDMTLAVLHDIRAATLD
jgi:hypothetical protein